MEKRVIAFAVFMIMLSYSASATFILGNLSYNIDSGYAPGGQITGWINISLANEPSGSLLTSNSRGSARIIDILDDNAADYSCNPSSCNDDYILSNGQDTKNLALANREKKTVAFNISGILFSMSNLSFYVNINNGPSCLMPAEMELFSDSDSSFLWKPWSFTNDFLCTYETGSGCFESTQTLSEVNITTTPFCENITLVKSGKFRIGAWVRKISPARLTMELYNVGGGNPLISCTLPEGDSNGGERDCVINFNNTLMQEYYVCVKSNVSNAYTTKMETHSPCGFFAVNGIPPSTSQAKYDYYLYARGAQFANLGSFIFDRKLYQSAGADNELVDDTMSYLREKYAGGCADCEVNCTNGCSIVARFSANMPLTISVFNLDLPYLTDFGGTSTNKIYDTTPVSAKVSSGFVKLDLSYTNLSAPMQYGNYNLSLALGGQSLLTRQISVASIPIVRSILPGIAAAGISTKFSAAISSNKTVVSYVWDFGDGSDTETSTQSFLEHTYSSVGIYNLTLEVEDSSGFIGTGETTITVRSPVQIVNSTLKDYRARINNLTSQLNGEPSWYRNLLKESIGLEDLSYDLTDLEKKFSSASSDEDYASIAANLSELEVPKEIRKTELGSFPVFPDTDAVNLDYLVDIGAGDLDNESASPDDYKTAIAAWFSENVDASADYFTIFAYYDREARQLANYYNVHITAKEPSDSENYFFVDRKATFNTDASVKEYDDATGVRFDGLQDRDIEFAVLEESNPLEIGMYLSPELDKLDLNTQIGTCDYDKKCEEGEDSKNCRADCKPWGWAILFLIILIIIAIGVYILLEEWYKRKYEQHLFKNRNDLYNLVHFINNALSQGMKKEDIVRNLKKSGWHSEQIEYAFKKVKGRKTGMPVEFGTGNKKPAAKT